MTTGAPPILEIRGLRKRFHDVEVLRGINLVVLPQQLVFVIGPSGSGKSTLLRCCNRLEEASAGSIRVDGVDITARSTDINAMRRQIGMVFQSFNLYPHMTALRNVTLALAKVLGKPRAEAERIGMAALDRVGLADKARSYPGELSGGQQQRVAIARAIVGDRRLVLADEPTGALDSVNSESVMRMLRATTRRGAAAVVVTHEPQLASWADRVVFLRDGRLVDQTGAADGPESLLHAAPGERA
jgi:polar amino acid transport system ATP-binding protein